MAEREEIRLTARWVAEAMGGSIVGGDAGTVFAGVSIDTRTIGRGELYVAIRGERFDGADFVSAAAAAGAGGVVVTRGRGRELAGTAVVIEADDTVASLQALAARIRRESGARVVAITGSAGKTTTKEVTAAFLADRYRIIRNRGNLNNHIGLPLSLVDLRKRPDIAVVELGMNHAGEISTLVRVATPDVRVWTNVGEAHLGFFDSVDRIADAKAEIFEGAGRSTLLVANADDERIGARIGEFAGRVVTFGIDRPADVGASAIVDRGIDGTRAKVTTPRGSVDISTPLVGRGNLANVLAATAVALEFDVPLDVIAERAKVLEPAAHRGQVLRLPDGVTVVDDSYNANPTAMRQALAMLANDDSGTRRIAVLGEMLELGHRSTDLHEMVGRAVADLHVDLFIAVGAEAADAMARAAVDAGMAAGSVRYFASSEEAAEAAVALIARGDVVLVKGSRGVRTDRVVDRLKGRS